MTDAAARPTPPLARLRTAGRVLVVLALTAGLILAWQHRGSLDAASISTTIGAQPAAPLIFVVAHIVASLLFIPRTAMGGAAGMMFGTGMGLVWTTLGSLLGAVAGFLLARYVNAGLIDPEAVPRLGPLLLRCEREGWRAVVVLRIIPIVPHSVANYALGLTRLSLADFALGSFLGQIPATVVSVEFGAAGQEILAGKAGWLLPTAIGLVVLALSLALPRLIRRRPAA